MNKNILIVLGGAIVAALLVALLVQITLGRQESGPIEGAAVEVLVAAKDLKKGSELDEGDLKWQEWPEETLFKGAVLRDDGQVAHEALTGRLDRSFSKGEAVVRKAILKETTQNYVVARLKAGERAISIKVSAEDMVAGFIRPGSYVDVILTYRQRIDIDDDAPEVQSLIALNLDNIATETILENVRILAIDQKAELKEDDKIKIGKTVTLAVAIRDAEKLALATELGEITLVMRGIGDDGLNEDAPAVTDARLTSITDEVFEEYEQLKKESKTGVHTESVRIYNGAQVQTIPVQ